MINYWTELHGEITCDKCKATLDLFTSEEMCKDIDADMEIEDKANAEGWEVDGMNAVCYDCLTKD